jgi:uncharacterized membrane protein HdeD (DUF308 family)
MASAVREAADTTVGRWFTVLWGIGALVVGLLLATRPITTAVFLVQVMAMLWLVGGIIDIVSAVFGRAGEHRAWRLVGGAVAIFAGLVLLGNSVAGAFLVVTIQFYLIAISAIVNGIINIAGRFQGLSGWGRVVLGIVQVVIGVFFVLNPVPGLLAFIPVFGVVVAIGGVLTIAGALFLRPSASRAAQPA